MKPIASKIIIINELEQIKADAHISINITQEKTKLGIYELAIISCSPSDFDKVINIATKYKCPHEKFITSKDMGVKIYF